MTAERVVRSADEFGRVRAHCPCFALSAVAAVLVLVGGVLAKYVIMAAGQA
jgi:formate-dependent nitrite reductase membrane component NrfD